MDPFSPLLIAERILTQFFASFVIYHKKMADNVEENAHIHFVGKRDFKGVNIAGTRKSKKNRALEFLFTATAESLSEDDEIKVRCSSAALSLLHETSTQRAR